MPGHAVGQVLGRRRPLALTAVALSLVNPAAQLFYAVHGTPSQVRAWRPTAGGSSARTLGIESDDAFVRHESWKQSHSDRMVALSAKPYRRQSAARPGSRFRRTSLVPSSTPWRTCMPSLHKSGPLLHRGLEQPLRVNDGARSGWVPVDELLTARFLSRNTSFSSFGALLSASGLSPARFSDLGAQPGSSWDDFIRRSSRFPDWNAMLRDARGEWLMLRLGVIVDA